MDDNNISEKNLNRISSNKTSTLIEEVYGHGVEKKTVINWVCVCNGSNFRVSSQVPFFLFYQCSAFFISLTVCLVD